MNEFLKDLGEHKFLSQFLLPNTNSGSLIQGIGDDCAVLDYSKEEYLLVTTDLMVEDRHFTREWFDFKQIGMKLMEINVSDISSMGGKSLYGFLSLAFPGNMTSSEANDFFKGLYQSADRHGVQLIGGDTTEGEKIILNLTLMGTVKKSSLTLRSGCQDGDLLCVTGCLGKSAAGLAICQAGQKGDIAGFLEPKARSYEEAALIASLANAMIDISDGLASEAKHLASQSNKQITINKSRIPISPAAEKAARQLSSDPYQWALEGGEDYELLFSLPPQKLDLLKKVFQDFTCIGSISQGESLVFLEDKDEKQIISRGYEHFKSKA